MRCWIVMGALVLAGAQQASAQYMPGEPTPQEYIDAYRPVIQPRALTPDETATMKRLSSQFLKKGFRPNEALLLELHPLAQAGDKTAIKAMMVGWDSCGPPWKTTFLQTSYSGGEATLACNQLAALWAMKVWNTGDQSRDVARIMMYCFERQQFATYGNVKGPKCGVNARIEADFDSAIDRYAGNEKGSKPPRSITVTDYLLAPKMTPEEERAKFDSWIAAYSKGQRPNDDTRLGWIDAYIKRQGPAAYKEWSDAIEKFWAIENGRIGAERVAGEEAHKQRIADWEKLNALRTSAKAERKSLPAAEEQKFVTLSFQLRGKYIVPYGMENVLMDAWARDDFCANGPSNICERQRDLARARQSAADEERLARELAWSRPRAGGDVSVRTYDQNGNFLGASSVPAWQADILAGR